MPRAIDQSTDDQTDAADGQRPEKPVARNQTYDEACDDTGEGAPAGDSRAVVGRVIVLRILLSIHGCRAPATLARNEVEACSDA